MADAERMTTDTADDNARRATLPSNALSFEVPGQSFGRMVGELDKGESGPFPGAL